MDAKFSDILYAEIRCINMVKTILISGATGNLGSAVLKKFLENDFQIAALVSDRHRNDLKATTSLKTFPVDLLDENQVQQVIRQVVEVFGSIDMAMLTAGGFAMGSLADTGEEALIKMYRLNFLTAYHAARHIFLQMKDQVGGGQIILTGSRPAIHPGSARDMLSYALSKSLVFRLAEVINEDGRSGGITASVIIPGIIDTPQNREAMPGANFNTWVTPAEIADNVYHLTTPAGRQLRESVIKIYGESQT
jgi:NAD(P)-dependent dehydrogenase (short-subunit alcohol dehydrogenase family)